MRGRQLSGGGVAEPFATLGLGGTRRLLVALRLLPQPQLGRHLERVVGLQAPQEITGDFSPNPARDNVPGRDS